MLRTASKVSYCAGKGTSGEVRGEEQVRLDPLGDVEVQRALALARARESYPLLPRDTLVLYCDAAWEAARRADPKGRDLVGAFDRALLTIAWTHRRTGGRVPLAELVEQTIPRIALQPFIAAPAVLAVDELEEPAEAEPAVAAARRPVFRRPLLRVPFTSPLPVGAAVAAGAIGIALLHETRVLPIAPLEQSANDDLAVSNDSPARMGGGSEPAPAVEGPLAAIGSGATSPPVFAAPGSGQSSPLAGGGAGTEVASSGDDSGAAGSSGGAAAPDDAPAPVQAVELASANEPVAAETGGAPAPPRPVVTIELPEPKMVLGYAAPPRVESPPSDSDDPDEPSGSDDRSDGSVPGEPVDEERGVDLPGSDEVPLVPDGEEAPPGDDEDGPDDTRDPTRMLTATATATGAAERTAGVIAVPRK